MTKDEILRKYEDDNEYHFHEVDRAWIMEAMEEYAQQQVKNFINKSLELGVSYSTLYKMILRKEIDFILVCGKYYFN